MGSRTYCMVQIENEEGDQLRTRPGHTPQSEVVYDATPRPQREKKKPWPKPDAWEIAYEDCSPNMKAYMAFGRSFMFVGKRWKWLIPTIILLFVVLLEVAFAFHWPLPTIWGYHHIALPRTPQQWFHFLIAFPFCAFGTGFLGGCVGVIIMAIHICIDTEISVESRFIYIYSTMCIGAIYGAFHIYEPGDLFHFYHPDEHYVHDADFPAYMP